MSPEQASGQDSRPVADILASLTGWLSARILAWDRVTGWRADAACYHSSMSPGSSRIRLSMPLIRALFAIVALVSQLALGSLVLPDQAAARSIVDVRSATVLCKSSPPGLKLPSHQERHPTQETVCLLDGALELPAVILIPAVILPPLRLPTAGRLIGLPPARAPPSAVRWAQRARGPPNLA